MSVLVTGAGCGIGEATARLLAERGEGSPSLTSPHQQQRAWAKRSAPSTRSSTFAVASPSDAAIAAAESALARSTGGFPTPASHR